MASPPSPLPPSVPPLVILAGPRGSGKTQVAGLLSAALARPFIDLDDRTAATAGFAACADALRTLGEPRFRAAECDALRAVLARQLPAGAVLALGGGTPTYAPSLELLQAARARSRAAVVYLQASAGALRARLSATDLSARPPLMGADPLSEIEQLLAAREPVYRAVADLVLSTESLTPQTAADHITAWLRRGRA